MEDNENLNNNNDMLNSSMFSSGGDEGAEFASMFSAQPEETVENPTPSANPEPKPENIEQMPSMFADEPQKPAEEKPAVNNANINSANMESAPAEAEIKVEQPSTPLVDQAEDDDEAESAPSDVVTVRPVKFKKFDATPPIRTIKKNLDIMQDISMHISVELGRTKLSIKEVMDFTKGSIVELNKIAGEQVEVLVNGKLVAKGEVIVIEDRFGVRITSTNIAKNPITP